VALLRVRPLLLPGQTVQQTSTYCSTLTRVVTGASASTQANGMAAAAPGRGDQPGCPARTRASCAPRKPCGKGDF
jgi:hypothetical protein